MIRKNWDLSLNLNLEADDEQDIVAFLEEIARKIKAGNYHGEANYCSGVYDFLVEVFDPLSVIKPQLIEWLSHEIGYGPDEAEEFAKEFVGMLYFTGAFEAIEITSASSANAGAAEERQGRKEDEQPN